MPNTIGMASRGLPEVQAIPVDSSEFGERAETKKNKEIPLLTVSVERDFSLRVSSPCEDL